MKITHYCNSFVSIVSGSSTIVCDPWIGKADNNAWLSYPIIKRDGGEILNKLNPTHIYISHLHNDHFDPKTLIKFTNKNKVKLIIKKFNNDRLKKKIKDLQFKNIIEITPWTKVKLNRDFDISIIPQETNNKDGIDSKIIYDLDTSIIIKSNLSKKIFYNNVDNPLSKNDIKKLNKFVSKKYNNKINVCCFPIGGASEYPHCFFNINKAVEMKKIIKSSVLNVKEKLNILKPDIFFPAGGNYILYGKYSKLNNFIAQPKNYFKIFKNFSNLKQKNICIEGGNSIKFTQNNWLIDKTKDYKKKEILKKIQLKFSNENYGYEKYDKNLKLIDNLFLNAKKNYLKIMNGKYKNFNWTIKFHIFDNLKLNKKFKISKRCKPIKEYKIESASKKNHHPILECYLDKSLFYSLLKRKFIWNIALSGSLIMFKRKPNKFFPDVVFSLNFLTC